MKVQTMCYVNWIAKTKLLWSSEKGISNKLKCLHLGLSSSQLSFLVVSQLNDVLEHVYHLEFVACALSTPNYQWFETRFDHSAHLPYSLQECGPCGHQSSTSEPRVISDLPVQLPHPSPWVGPCLELSVLVGSLLQFMPHICCIEGYCVDLVFRQKWGESLGEGESLGLHLCFSFLRTPSNCMMLRPERQTNSPGGSSMNK